MSDKWVIIAPERAKRPVEFVIARERARIKECPFCPGNEEKTPLATLVYLEKKKGIVKSKDQAEFRHKNWLIRCFPNLYPALKPIAKLPAFKEFHAIPPVGFHEVLVESPIHNEHPNKARLKQLSLVIEALIDRVKFFSKEKGIKYVAIFRNHKRMGGVSLSHTHMQMIAMTFIPKLILNELNEAQKYYKKKGKCAFCNIIELERKVKERIIYEDNNFIAFCPWASLYPYEFWIFPLQHEASFIQMKAKRRKEFAKAMKICFKQLAKVLNDPPYNFGFHISPIPMEDYSLEFHWHLEVYPKLSILAGLEKSMGIYINTVAPENAAKELRMPLYYLRRGSESYCSKRGK